MTSTPIAQCAKCSKLCGPDEFMVLIPLLAQRRDDIGRLKAYCERCYCAVGFEAKQLWKHAMRTLERCSCKWVRHAHMPDVRLGDPCESCRDKEWFWTNLDEVIFQVRKATPYKPAIGFRAYNRWGRCVSWSR